MSTRFTKRGVPMVESQSLQLTQSTSQLNDVVVKYLSQRLIEKGYISLTPSLLSFLSILECGINYGSEIARNLGVTRQMVAKTVKELCHSGYLEQIESVGKQKEIHFTEAGEQLMSDARLLLSEVDDFLCEHSDAADLERIISEINAIAESIKKNVRT